MAIELGERPMPGRSSNEMRRTTAGAASGVGEAELVVGVGVVSCDAASGGAGAAAVGVEVVRRVEEELDGDDAAGRGAHAAIASKTRTGNAIVERAGECGAVDMLSSRVFSL